MVPDALRVKTPLRLGARWPVATRDFPVLTVTGARAIGRSSVCSLSPKRTVERSSGRVGRFTEGDVAGSRWTGMLGHVWRGPLHTWAQQRQ